LASARVAAVAAALLAAVSLSATARAAWTTYGHDALRSGIDPDSTSPLPPTKIWETPSTGTGALDGKIYAQPLVFGSQVYVATENDSVFALDAATGAVRWQRSIGTPVPEPQPGVCGDIGPKLGITSTPVVDPATSTLYVVGATWDGKHVHHVLDAFDLSNSGATVPGFPVNVDPPASIQTDPSYVLQRTALALDDGRVIVGYGGNAGDCPQYWGWLIGAPESGFGTQLSFQVNAGGGGGAIWGGGDGAVVDASGNIFVATGNGSSGAFGDQESVLRLDSGLNLLDYWAPTDWASLDSTDQDIGSSEPLLLPGRLLFQAGKDRTGRLLQADDLGHIGKPLASLSMCGADMDGAAVYLAGTIYVPCQAGLQAVTLDTSGATPKLTLKSGFNAPSDAVGTPIVAGGLVWDASYNDGVLYGLDPNTGSTKFSANLGTFDHFATPSASGGRLFAPNGTRVTAFQIANVTATTTTATVLAASPDPAAVGQTVALTATVAPSPDGGTVAFTDGGVAIPGCSAAAILSGEATCSTSFAQAGSHALVAAYSGDAGFGGSRSAALTEVVNGPGGGPGGPRGLTLSAGLHPSRFTARKGATLSAAMSVAGVLTASITFKLRGHRARGSCRTSAKGGRKCTLTRTVTLAFDAAAGANSFKFAPAALKPGRYTAVLRARDAAGQTADVLKLPFTVLRPRPGRHRR
jgi:outer membrane protein assembly factor BamB